MLELQDPLDLCLRGSHRWADGRLTIHWIGHFYLPGHAAGAASAAALADLLTDRELAAVAGRLKGVFGVFVRDRRRGDWQIAVDGGGLYKIFYDGRGVATSFRQLLAARRAKGSSVAVERLAEFLAYGGVSRSSTFLAGVHKLSGAEVLILPAGGGPPRTTPKALPEPPLRPAEEEVVAHFADLGRSLEGRALSVDATGGFDTRLVMGILDREGLPFELAVSGQPGTADTEIARTLAERLARRFHLAGHDLADLDEAVVATYRFGDGLTDVRRLHRDRQAALLRLERGVQVMAHGGGGEFFRDHYVIQDFPFYGSSRVNLERFHDLRMTPVQLPGEALSPMGAEILRGLRAEMISCCADLRAPTNHETYDRIYLHLRSPEFYGQYFSNYVNHGLDVVAPLLDLRVVQAAMRLSPWARFYHGWHRRMLTRHCPELAALPTADGYTASSSPRLMAVDLVAYGRTQLARAMRKASQRLRGRSRFYTAGAFVADAPDYITRLRATPHFPVAIERLKAIGLLAPDASGDRLGDVHAGRALTLGLFLGELEGFA